MARLLLILSLCAAMAYSDLEENVPERFRNVTCLNSKLVVEERPDKTYIKIVSDSGEQLLNINSLNTNVGHFVQMLSDITTILFPSNNSRASDISNDYYISHTKTDGSIRVKVESKSESEYMEEVIPEVAGIEPGRTTCARILRLDLIVDPAWDVNRSDGYNMTSLLWSCYFGLTDLAKRLVERGADVNEVGLYAITPLTGAIRSNRDELVEFLLQKGAAVNGPRSLSILTPLQMAAHLGRLNAARTLLEHGAPVDATDNVPMTPLLYATDDGHLDLVDLLLKKGADVNALNSQQQTPLHVAVMHGAEDLIHRIVEAGADVNAKDSEGNTPLILAVSSFYNEDTSAKVVQHLLHHHNPDVNVHNKEGKTALSIATWKGYSKVQDLLKSKGAI